MEITGFVTQNFLSSFAGTLVAVEIIVFTTKNFPIIKRIPTKFYTFILNIKFFFCFHEFYIFTALNKKMS